MNNHIYGFRGPHYQTGSGFGAVFRKFFKWVFPILKENASPIVKQGLNTIVTEIGEGINKFTQDMKEKSDIKSSAKRRFSETVKNIRNKTQTGGRKKKKKKNCRKKNYF